MWIRRKLGDIYFELKYPTMAGRYWYLEENKTLEMKKAYMEFEKMMGNSSSQIVRALKYKDDIEILKNVKLDQDIHFIPNQVKERLIEEPEDSTKDGSVIFGCFSIIVCIMILALIGMYTVFQWIF